MPIPQHMPRMHTPPFRVDSLAWYPEGTPGLDKMHFEARGEIVPLTYPSLKHPGLLGVPRTLAPAPAPEADFRSVGAFEFHATFKKELRPEQAGFSPSVFSTLENELGCIGEAPTGFGKTVVGCELITRLGRPTCIVIPKGDLDWTGELLSTTDIPEDKIDIWQGGRLPREDAWVVIAMLQSVYRLAHYPAEIYRRFACLIIDETHRVGSQEFSLVLRQFPAMFRLGLSATPERRDGKMDLVHAHIGWRHIVGKTDAAQPDYYVIPSNWTEPRTQDGKRIPYDPARTNPAKRSLMHDAVRNASIAGAVYRAHKGGRRTLIFIEQVKHGEQIKKALLAMRIPASSIVEYNGGINAEDKARAKACPPGIILIATFKYTAEGTNIPALDCVVMAHPIFDPRQAVGRILRKVEGKATPVVLDVWDSECGTLKSIALKRWEYLRKQGARWRGTFS